MDGLIGASHWISAKVFQGPQFLCLPGAVFFHALARVLDGLRSFELRQTAAHLFISARRKNNRHRLCATQDHARLAIPSCSTEHASCVVAEIGKVSCFTSIHWTPKPSRLFMLRWATERANLTWHR